MVYGLKFTGKRAHNPDFNYGGFAIIAGQAGLNNYKISVKEWAAKTNAFGLMASAGRYCRDVNAERVVGGA